MTPPTQTPPCIVFVLTEDWYFWGHRLALARAARDAGWKVVVATASGTFHRKIIAEGFSFYPLRLRRSGRHPWTELLAILDLAALYRLIRPDIVHHIAIKPILYGSLAAKMVGVPGIVNAIVGLGYVFIADGWKHRLLRRIVEIVYRICLSGEHIRVTFENPDDRRLFLQKRLVTEEQAILIAGVGVNTTRFAPTPEPPSEPVVLLASRMIWDKGIGELVQAAALLRARGVPGRVVLAGVPDTSNPTYITETQLQQWHNEGTVEWIGYQEDMPAILAQAHIACLPSYREGLPVALIEAASCARAIVTTDTPGCREVVRHGWNGLLVPLKDPVALADALQTLLTDGELRRTMGQRGREMVLQRFTQEIIIRHTFDVYRTLR